ncbi:MAG: cysteine--tRNA ligase [Patescibacteria group bacterium]
MLKLYNSLGNKIQAFKPIKGGQVTIYSCGPTVYGRAHIGNLSSFLFSDLLKRYLRYRGYKVAHAMNLTDVDDKTIKGSQQAHLPLETYTAPFIAGFFKDLRDLNIAPADYYPRATQYVPKMVELVKLLLVNGSAYRGQDNSIYFNIKSFPRYGQLINLKKQRLKDGARISSDDYDKEQASDFVLWKAWQPSDGDIFWDTDIGKGRPGWHLECSVMSTSLLGKTIDIHTGGIDLKFPHHSNEIAQSESAYKRLFVRYWLHRAFLQMGRERMAKRLGNVLNLTDLVKQGHSPRAFRFLILTNHYRTPLIFAEKTLVYAENSLKTIDEFVGRLEKIISAGGQYRSSKDILKFKKEFIKNLDSDLNSPKAIALLFDYIRKINIQINKERLSVKEAKIILNFLKDIDRVWGFIFPLENRRELADEEKILLEARKNARQNKDFAKSDQIRQELLKKGVEVRDGKDGEQTWVFLK